MIDKHAAARGIEQLKSEVEKLASGEHDGAWQGRQLLLFAEIDQWLGHLLPGESPLLKAFRSLPAPREVPNGQLDLAKAVLASALRWNEARQDSDATASLAQDVDRLLGSRFWKHPIVLTSITILMASVAFAVFGLIRFKDMQLNVVDEIAKKRNEVIREFDGEKTKALQLLAANTSQLDDISRKVTSAKGDLARLDTEMTAAVNRLQSSLSERASEAVEKATIPAREAIARAREAALKDLATQKKEAADAIARAANERAAEIKAQKTPEFDAALEKDAQRLGTQETRIRSIEGRTEAVAAVVTALTKPAGTFVDRFAAYFREAVIVVHVAAVALALLCLVELVVVALTWRRMRQLLQTER